LMDAEAIDILSTLPIWRTVRLGIKRTAREYLADSVRTKWFGPDVEWILDSIPVCASSIELDLVRFPTSILRFNKKFPTHADVAARAIECGLEECPAEVAVVLRAVYLEQPVDEWVKLAMSLPRRSDHFYAQLWSHRCGDLYLTAQPGPIDGITMDEDLWVFKRPRSLF
ncbi:MAG: hypothetical protein Q8O19_06510, partial [Rectinemataceae bacterium]|nr:hypothetical protein [Rectinemataceae bacterium]